MTTKKRKKTIIWVVAAAYMLLLLRFTVFRDCLFDAGMFANGKINLIPVQNYVYLIREHQYLYAIYLFAGNIAWFIPFGFLLPYLTGQPQKVMEIVLVGFLLSFAIEFLQYALGTGESEVDDVLLNTFGTLIGFLIYRAYINRKIKAV